MAPRVDGSGDTGGITTADLIKKLKNRLLEAEDVLDLCYDSVNSPNALPADFDNYSKAAKVHDSALKTLQDALARQRVEATQARAAGRLERKKEIAAALEEQYGDRGPQYTHLIDLIADITVKMEAHIEDGGSDDAYMKMAALKIDLIGQLQRYTETTKAEATVVTAQINEVALRMAGVVEAELKDQPKVLKRIMGGWRLLLEGPKE